MSTLFLPLERTAPEERAIIDAARAYVGACRAVLAMERADVDEEVYYTAWGNVQGAEAALVAAVDAAPEVQP